MSDILLDKNGDINFSNGKISIKKSLSQKVTISLQTFKSEWFLDDSIGIPYFQTILGKKIQKEQIDTIFSNEILKVDGVAKIISFSSSLESRHYTYTAEILSKDNNIEFVEGKL